MLFLTGAMVGVFEATNLSMDFAWVCMVRPPPLPFGNGTGLSEGNNTSLPGGYELLDWDKAFQVRLVA